MKNFMQISALAALLIIAIGNVFADESANTTPIESSKDWSVTLALKAWIATWDPHNQVEYRSGTAAENVVLGSGAVTALYKDYFISYGQTQSASSQQISFTTGSNNGSRKYNASRNETDFTLGYYLTSAWALMIGQKTITNDFTPAVAGQGTASNYQFSGPVIGATYFDSFEGSKLVGYGTLVLGKLNASVTPTLGDISNDGYVSAEIGLIYPLTERFRATASLRVQSENFTVSGRDSYDSTTKGVMVGGSYTF